MPEQQIITKPDKLHLKNVQILWPNFAGAEKPYNKAGDRNFHILLPDWELAKAMADQGWNVKVMPKREEDEPDQWHIKVKVNLSSKNQYPPRIIKVTMDENGQPVKRLALDATTVMLLDILRIQWADVTLSPWVWSYQNKQGISAYLEVMYAVTEDNPLDTEWDDRFAATLFDDEDNEPDEDDMM